MSGVGTPPSSLAPWKRPQPRPGAGKGTSWRRPSSSSSSASASTGTSGWSKGSTRMSLGASAVNATEVDGHETCTRPTRVTLVAGRKMVGLIQTHCKLFKKRSRGR